MKKTLIFLMLSAALAFMLSSCSTTTTPTTYTVVYNTDAGYYSTTLALFECNNTGDAVNVITVEIKEGERKDFTASKGTIKLKIHILTEGIWKDINGWVQQVFPLKIGGNTIITIDNNTVVGPQRP